MSSTDLKKAFHTPPFSDRVEVDQTVELRCVPPDGYPVAELSWTKNGVTVDPKQDPNYIISNEGNLLIAAAKLSDMANYSCVAENVANRRVSQPARLTVYGKYVKPRAEFPIQLMGRLPHQLWGLPHQLCALPHQLFEI